MEPPSSVGQGDRGQQQRWSILHTLSRLCKAQNRPRRIKCHQREYSGSKALEVGRLCGFVLCWGESVVPQKRENFSLSLSLPPTTTSPSIPTPTGCVFAALIDKCEYFGCRVNHWIMRTRIHETSRGTREAHDHPQRACLHVCPLTAAWGLWHVSVD